MTWPFPTKEHPLTPWTPKQEREYQRKQREKIPAAPFVCGAVVLNTLEI
jgi:hypothetical protein